MKITSAVLDGYKRMMLRGVRHFEMTPHEIVQLIVGTNGSGKSSFLSELSVLPAEGKYFLKDGSKVVEVDHEGHHYVLTHWFMPAGRYSFKRDDEELNKGLGITTYRELCVKYFGYDEEIHQLVLGKERFTQMNATRRREWLTRLSPTNYDYALKMYREYKEKLRDRTGARKTAKEHLVEAHAKVVSIEEQQKLEHDIELLHRDLQSMMELRKPADFQYGDLESKQQQGLRELQALSMRLLQLKVRAPYGAYGVPEEVAKVRNDWGELEAVQFRSQEDVSAYIEAVRLRIAGVEAIRAEHAKEHAKHQKTLDILKQTGAQSVEKLQAIVVGLQAERERLLGLRATQIEILDAGHAKLAVEAVTDTVVGVFLAIEENSDRRYSKVVSEGYTRRLEALREMQTQQARERYALTTQLSHVEKQVHDNQVVCPNCRHAFTLGLSGKSKEELALLMTTLAEEEAKSEAERVSILAEKAALDTYFGLYRQYLDVVRVSPALNPFWAYLTESQFLMTNPKRCASVLRQYTEDIGTMVSVAQIDTQIAEQEKLILQASDLGDVNVQLVQASATELELYLHQETERLIVLRDMESKYVKYRSELSESDHLAGQIQQHMSRLDKLTDDLVETLRRDTFNHCIRQLQSTLAKKEASLSEIHARRERHAQLEADIAQYEDDVVVLKAIVEALSPTEGLIAKGLMGFTQSVIDEMNDIIRLIWSYPLVIQDCATMMDENAELDYKFPLSANDQDPVDDVKFGSDGMQEIIDLAFKVMAMKHLKLDSGILYLDEFGKAMDGAHRHAASALIQHILYEHGFSQVFMVSHDTYVHGGLSQSEVCVLDAANISVPKVYNQHVSMQ